MNFKENADQIKIKYAIAVAIGVIKSKPPNLTIDEFVELLKCRIQNNDIDPDIIDLCSDDFNMDPDDNEIETQIEIRENVGSPNLLENFEFKGGHLEMCQSVEALSILKDVDLHIPEFTDDITQVDNSIPQKSTNEHENLNTLYRSCVQSIENVVFPFSKEAAYSTAPEETQSTIEGLRLNLENQIDVNSQYVSKKRRSICDKSTFYETLNDTSSIEGRNESNNITNMLRYNKHIEAFVDLTENNINHKEHGKKCSDLTQNTNDELMIVSVSYDNMENDKRQYNTDATFYQTQSKHIKDIEINTNSQQDFDLTKTILNLKEKDDHLNNIEAATCISQATSKFHYKNINKNIEKNARNDDNITQIDSQATEIYTLDWPQEDTHISQSQNFDSRFDIPKKYLAVAKTNRIDEGSSKTKIITQKMMLNYAKDYDFNRTLITPNIAKENTVNDVALHNQKMGLKHAIDDDFNETSNRLKAAKANTLNKPEPLNQKMRLDYATDDDSNKTSIKPYNAAPLNQKIEINHKINDDDFNETSNRPNTSTNDLAILNDPNDIEQDVEMFNSQTDAVIPFKIIEELNKIKKYLRGCERRNSMDGYSTDSGFVSDSQVKSSSRSGLQLSGNYLNQSSHCLIEFITNCTLNKSIFGVLREISEVLGELIDKLHNDENYPTFLDEIINIVNIMLQELYQNENGDDNGTDKEDILQRLLLLNTSKHIIIHTIDNISSILNKVHSNITNKDIIYELNNITEIENLCYVFYALELLLLRLERRKNLFGSQKSTQLSSQDDSLPKRSELTAIWKRKWDPNYKNKVVEDKNVEEIPKKANLSEVLNRLVVDCMEGYSLISYAALQCFNLLQTT